MLRAMNLALSNLCGGRCVFCPSTRGQGTHGRNMSWAVAERCIEQAKSNGIRAFSVGENGDALLNPQFLDILGELRCAIPNAWVILFTNFQNLTPEISRAILRDGLVNAVTTNIDGTTTYQVVKGMPLGPAAQNLRAWMDIREYLPVTLTIQVLTAPAYARGVRELFGTLPGHLLACAEMADEYDRVVSAWSGLLGPRDTILRSPSVGWAERGLIRGDQARFACTQLERMRNEAFIAPDGSWYICCLMDQQTVTIGNIMEKPLAEMENSLQRRELIEALERRDYAAIGYPCTTAQACQCANGEN